jgi:cellulose synthase/poly-beta-1,6-N-acetylglucosamine synthase-like glycosyltransferase
MNGCLLLSDSLNGNWMVLSELVDISLLLVVLSFLLIPYVGVIVLVFTLGRKLKLNKNYNYKPTVSIFLPTYNEAGFIGRKLENLISQSYQPLEILVYDCSTDETPLIVEEYKKRFPIINLVRQPERIGMARTLNQAFKDARGDIFIKTDCDSLAVSKNCIKEIVANFADSKVGGATGICVADNGVERYFREFMTSIQIAETNIDSTVIAHASSVLAFRSSLLEPVDALSMADDTEEFVKIRKKGYRTVVDHSAISKEEVPDEFRKRRLQKDRRSQGIIRVLMQNTSMLFNKKYGMFGFLILPLEFFILVLSPLFLIALGIVLGALLYIINPFLVIPFVASIGLMFVYKSNLLSAIIDTQLSGLMGTITNLMRRDSSIWAKVR